MILQILFFIACVLVVYHHLAYPYLLTKLGARYRRKHAEPRVAVPDQCDLPSVTLIVPAYQEEVQIKKKIRNLAALDYPTDLLTIIVASDGSTDATVERATAVLRQLGKPSHIAIHAFRENRGKVPVLNDLIENCSSQIVALTDVSAELEPDVLLKAATHFAVPDVAVVGGRYVLTKLSGEGETAYWQYQNQIRLDEATLGAPMGMNGAFYAFERALWTPLEPDTINDDFILPMKIIAAGAEARYDPEIQIGERERTRRHQEWQRRIRIAAGNVQQVWRLKSLGHLSRPGLAFCFLSGKALRAFMPLIMVFALLSNAWLAFEHWVYTALFMAQAAGYLAAFGAIAFRGERLPKILDWLGYLVEGHLAGLLGSVRYMFNLESNRSQAALKDASQIEAETYLHPLVAPGKRVIDIVAGLAAFVVFAIAFIPVAIAIKTSSPGPLFYRQLRVGRSWPDRTELFHLIKFRTMRVDAETSTGAVWATENDPRITPVGQFLRTSRLDELPQCINVLRGEMSIIGPRPERPQFFAKLESEIPYYTERTYGVLPGITGLAQVNQGYDTTIEDVRNKVFWDHTYALKLVSPISWFITDIAVMLKTVKVMVFRMGR